MVRQAHHKKKFELEKPGAVRVRIAPSPTGYFHIATARAGLANYLFAKKRQGVFILRIEDTDQQRYKPEYTQDILDNFKWLGLDWDEGPGIESKYGPYFQSQRLELYKKYLKKLLDEDKAYHCFCTEQDLEAEKQYLMSIGKAPIYSGKCAKLGKQETEERLAKGERSIIRFRTPIKKVIFNDLVRGEIEFDSSLIGDFSIAKSIDEPLYNLANVIDDFEMKISHVIRGEDHISNTPKQILVYEALGFSIPQFGHLPIILAPDKTKLSKRHGSVSIRDFRIQGYLPEALINFIAFLGWNPGTEREIYSLPSLIQEFSLERVKKGGAIFNQKRLDFLNGFYIRKKPIEQLTEACIPFLIKAGLIQLEKEKISFLDGKFIVLDTKEIIEIKDIEAMVSLYHERLKRLGEIPDLIDFFLKQNLDYNKENLKWKNQTDKELRLVLDRVGELLSGINNDNWNEKEIEKVLLPEAENIDKLLNRQGNRGEMLWPLRVALTGKQASAGPFEIAQVLGREKTLKRIEEAKGKV